MTLVHARTLLLWCYCKITAATTFFPAKMTLVIRLSPMRLPNMAIPCSPDLFLSLVAVPPGFTATPVDQTVHENDEAIFHCTATGNPTPTITWLKDGKTVATGDTWRFSAKRNQSGKYWCSAENGFDVNINASVLLDVQCKFEKSLICQLIVIHQRCTERFSIECRETKTKTKAMTNDNNKTNQ